MPGNSVDPGARQGNSLPAVLVADLYLRLSLDRTGEGAGIERQDVDGRQLCGMRGWTVGEVHIDNDTSAAGTKYRKGFEALLVRIAAGLVRIVVAWSLDRLTRNRRDTVRLIELCERHEVTIALVRGSDLDMSTPMGRMMADQLAGFARYEIDQKSDRQKRANAQRAEAGAPFRGGQRAFGYEPDGETIRPPEADAIRRAYDDVLIGVPLRAIARAWNDAGLHSGKPRRSEGHRGEPARWNSTGVRWVLRNPRYAGLRAYHGEVVAAGTWPALVPEQTWRAACEVLEDPQRRSGGGRYERRLLTGLALCAVCETTIGAGGRVANYPMIRCRAKGGPAVRGTHFQRAAQPVEDYVRDVVIARLAAPDAVSLLERPGDAQRADVDGLRGQARVLRARLDALASAFADGELDGSQLRTGTERVRGKLAEVEAAIADAGRVSLLGPLIGADGGPRASWDALSVDRRRGVVDTLMTVWVRPPGQGKRVFDPATVPIVWRQAR